MLSRSQRFRRLRHKRSRDERPRAPLSLFEQGGELSAQQARLHKSFSDQGVDTPRDEVVEAARMKRSVSDNFTTSRRSLFSSSQAAAVVTAMPAGPAVGDGATTVVATAVPVEQKRRCRAVNFHERVAVVLIPAAKDMQQEDKSTLWWTRNELQTFQRELVRALPPNTNLRQNILSLGELAAFAGCDFSAPFALCEPLQEVCKSAVAVPAKAVHCAAANSSSAEATAVVAVSITAALAVLDLNGRGASCLPAAAHTVAAV
jgi:hypothetical protein